MRTQGRAILLPVNALFRNITDTDKNTAVEEIIEHASPRSDFFLMLVLSVAMGAFGILLGSPVILIGSMLIAPLLYPLLSLALGIIIADEKLIGRSIYTLLTSFGLALAGGAVIGFLFSAQNATIAFALVVGESASLMYTLVAAIAGFAAAFAMVKPHLNESLPGVAISVSLVPPLAAAGIALSMLNWTVFSEALLLLAVNIIGIVFSAMVVFALMRFSVKRSVAERIVKREEALIKKEQESAIQEDAA